MNRFLFVLKVCLRDKIFLNGGRADRWEFFAFNIFAMLVRVVIGVAVTLLVNYLVSSGQTGTITSALNIVFVVINFILFVAQYTSTLRRLHDTNRSGHHLLPILAGLLIVLGGFILMNPIMVYAGEAVAAVGVLYAFVLCFLPGTPGDNRFGPPCPSIPPAPDAKA